MMNLYTISSSLRVTLSQFSLGSFLVLTMMMSCERFGSEFGDFVVPFLLLATLALVAFRDVNDPHEGHFCAC